jgi:hypothetical protein
MKQRILICFLLLVALAVKGQPTESQCYFSKKSGIIFSSRLLLLQLDSKRFLMEYYSDGGGVFSGLPSADTLSMDNGVLHSNKYAVTIEKNRMIVKSKAGKRKFKFRILDKCDATINQTRNWPVRETIRYKIVDRTKSQEFWSQTEPLLKVLCYPDFVNKMNEMKKAF